MKFSQELTCKNAVFIVGSGNEVTLGETSCKIPETQTDPVWFNRCDREFNPQAWRTLQLQHLRLHEDRWTPVQVEHRTFTWTEFAHATKGGPRYLRGHPGMGRTTALIQFAHSLPENLVPVYIDGSRMDGALGGQAMLECRKGWEDVFCFFSGQERYAKDMVFLLDNYIYHHLESVWTRMGLAVIIAHQDGWRHFERGWEVSALPTEYVRSLLPEELECVVQLCRNRRVLKEYLNHNTIPRGVGLPTNDQLEWLCNGEKSLSLVSAAQVLRLPFRHNWELSPWLNYLERPGEDLTIRLFRGNLVDIQFVDGLFKTGVSILNRPPSRCNNGLTSMIKCWKRVLEAGLNGKRSGEDVELDACLKNNISMDDEDDVLQDEYAKAVAAGAVDGFKCIVCCFFPHFVDVAFFWILCVPPFLCSVVCLLVFAFVKWKILLAFGLILMAIGLFIFLIQILPLVRRWIKIRRLQKHLLIGNGMDT